MMIRNQPGGLSFQTRRMPTRNDTATATPIQILWRWSMTTTFRATHILPALKAASRKRTSAKAWASTGPHSDPVLRMISA